MHPIDVNDPKSRKKRRFYEGLFIVAGMLGICLVGLAASRIPQEHAHFSFSVHPTYVKSLDRPASWASGSVDHRAEFLEINLPLSFNVYYTNVGPGVAVNVADRKASFIEPNISPTSESNALAEFERMRESEPPRGNVTLAKGDQEFVSAHGPILSPEDYDNLVYGRRVAYVMVELNYHDDSGKHIRHYCQVLQPPQPGGAIVWAYCENYNDEN